MKKYKKLIPFIFIFILFVITILFFVGINMDEVWNYGFSYAIRMGEIPYKDFNMVVTPFYSLFMTIPLLLWNNYLAVVLFYSSILTVASYLTYKMYKDRGLILLLLSLIIYTVITPSYNSFILVLLLFIIYLESSKFKSKNILIGVLVALAILTKQSIGLFYFIPMIYIGIKTKSLSKRLLGFIIPIIITFGYLLLTHSLLEFIDLCFLGLLDFTGNSRSISIISIILYVIMLIVSIKIISMNKKDVTNYYILGAYTIFIPIFDIMHLLYVVFLFGLLIVNNYKITGINIKQLSFVCLSLFLIVNGANVALNFSEYPNKLNHLKYKYINKDILEEIYYVNEYAKDKDLIIYDDTSYLYTIINNKKSNYLNLLNHGNHGYRGSEKLIKLLEEYKDKDVLILKSTDKKINNNLNQLNKKGYYYIIENYEIVETTDLFCIYRHKNFTN